jgi:hypothetical protein
VRAQGRCYAPAMSRHEWEEIGQGPRVRTGPNANDAENPLVPVHIERRCRRCGKTRQDAPGAAIDDESPCAPVAGEP